MESVDIAIYLLHSIQTSSKIDQGMFGGKDTILPGNLARVVKKQDVK